MTKHLLPANWKRCHDFERKADTSALGGMESHNLGRNNFSQSAQWHKGTWLREENGREKKTSRGEKIEEKWTIRQKSCRDGWTNWLLKETWNHGMAGARQDKS